MRVAPASIIIMRKAEKNMKTEKLLKISSVIDNLSDSGLTEGEPERSEITPTAVISSEDELIKIEYYENTEGGRVDSEITLEGKGVTVVRRGAVVSEMKFSEGLLHKSLYSVPPYSFDTEVYTKKIRNGFTAEGGKIDIFYTMKIGGQDKAVKMRIESL